MYSPKDISGNKSLARLGQIKQKTQSVYKKYRTDKTFISNFYKCLNMENKNIRVTRYKKRRDPVTVRQNQLEALSIAIADTCSRLRPRSTRSP